MGNNYLPFTELLSEIIDNRGRTCPTANFGIPLIATNCIKNESLYPAYEKVRYVSQATYDTWFRGHPKPGDLILVLKGTPGRVCLVPDPIDFCIAQDMVAIRANEKIIYSKYLFAILRSDEIQNKIENMHVGTLIPHFKKGDFERLFLPVLDRETQEIIGDFYFDFSEKIEVNSRMNATLESMARTVFQEMMIEGEGEEKTIGDVVTIVGGSTPSTTNPVFWNDGDINWATPKDLAPLQSPFLLETNSWITKLGLQEISSGLLPVGTVLLSSRAPIGYLAITQIPVAINQGFIAIKCTEKVPNYFVLNWLKENMEEIIGRANGTTFLEISKSNFRPMKIIVPSSEKMKAFVETVGPLYKKIVANLKESHTLASLRDTLLPKLISGEIRVNVS